MNTAILVALALELLVAWLAYLLVRLLRQIATQR